MSLFLWSGKRKIPGGSIDSRIFSNSDGKVGGCSEGWTLCMKDRDREVVEQIFGTKLWSSSEGKQSCCPKLFGYGGILPWQVHQILPFPKGSGVGLSHGKL